MAPISTPHYLVDQARRRLTPTLNNIPGMGVIEEAIARSPLEAEGTGRATRLGDWPGAGCG